MQVMKFQLTEPIETRFGGACLDFLHTPGCGFMCGAQKFRCSFDNVNVFNET